MVRSSDAPTTERLAAYQVIRDHVAKGALSMIDWANHKPENRGKKPKVGGHQASSMSSLDLLCALYLHSRHPRDLVAVKPHAAPVVYALMHLLGELDAEDMGRLREFKGPQPYPTRTKNPRFVDYTTSSEALGVCATIYDAYGAMVQNRALTEQLGAAALDTVHWAHCGDGELTEGQIDESLYDAGRWGLDNLVWIVDLNRQSLDRVMDDSGRLDAWVEAKFRGQGWEVRQLRWGRRAEALFAREGGEELRGLLERMTDAQRHPLLMIEGSSMRHVLSGTRPEGDLGELAPLYRFYDHGLTLTDPERAGVARALEGVDDEAIVAAVHHQGGHDLEALIAAYGEAKGVQGRPVAIVAHTVKGYETSGAGHPENHGMLLPTEEVVAWGQGRGLPADEPYPIPAEGSDAAQVLTELREANFDGLDHGWASAPRPDVDAQLALVKRPGRTRASTGEAFQSLNLGLLRTELAPYLHFGAPDVGQTTHLGPVIKSTGVFAPRDTEDAFAWLREGRRVAFDWRPVATGQFHALGIAEGNAMLWAYAFGRQRKRHGGRVPLLPVVTVYDKFFERGFNQLDYAVYANARFIAVGTPSGTGLSRETATHQSIQTLRMMMDLPGILSYEPAFGADVHVIYRYGLAQLWAPDGEAIYLRLTTQSLEQPGELPEDHEEAAIRGAYWLVGEDDRAPEAGRARVLFVASGRKLREAREAARILHDEDGVGSRILNVTSYEALWRDWDAYAHDPTAWEDEGRSYVLHDLFAEEDVNAPMIMTGDHVPSVSEWLPGALQRVRGARFLGPRVNGETGDLASVDALHGMGVEDLVRAAREELRWRQAAGLT